MLSAYLDDDLTEEQRAALDARLSTDSALRESLDGMRLVRDTLASFEVVSAPRSFAITAPPAPVRSRFGRFDLLARAGAMTAAVAFVVVLAGDLTGDGGTPVAEEPSAALTQDTEALAEFSTASDAGSGTIERAADIPAPAPDGADATDGSAPADGDDGAENAALETPDTGDVEPTVAAASQELQSTQEPGAADASAGDTAEEGDPGDAAGALDAAALPTNAGGSIGDALDPDASAPPGAAAVDDPDAPGDAIPAPGDAVDSAGADGDAERVDGGTGSGTLDEETALRSQLGETSADAANGRDANVLTEDSREVSGLAVGLGAVTALLAAASGLLWWRRREGTAGPV